MSRNLDDYSLVYWCSDPSPHRCGYCKNPEGSISHGMWAESLTVQDYQNLIDRGWRRSGVYCYKPIMDQICCPQYTIRCDTTNFQLSKSQKKIIKKFNKYINEDILNKADNCDENCDNINDFDWKERPKDNLEKFDEITQLQHKEISENCNSFDKCNDEQKQQVSIPGCSRETKNCDNNQPKPGAGADPTKPPCKKAKLLRLARKQEKLLKRGMSLEQLPKINNQQKSLEDFLEDINENSKHKLKLQLLNTHSPEWENYKLIEFELYKKYQMVIHNDPPEKCTIEGFHRFLVNSPLKITLEQIDENHKYFDLTANLFAKYQIAVHNDRPDECDKEQFVNFLIETPLENQKISNNTDLNYGSYHQLYWIDDKLIAVGVIDILPRCISAVYFFYDPDYRNLTLGTYGSLREAQLVRNLHQIVPSIQYYYMGFYIHSCPKMRYKGKLTPSYLLCPETYQWIPIEKCLPKLDIEKYSRLTDDLDAVDENACNQKDIDKIKLQIYRDRFITFNEFKTKFLSRSKQQLFDIIGQTIGKKCSRTVIIKCN